MKNKLKCVVALYVLLNNLTTVYGQTIRVVPDDQKVVHSGALSNPASGTYLVMAGVPQRSYCCEAYSEVNTVSSITAVRVGNTDLFTELSAQYRGSSGLRLPASGSLLNGKDRVCFYANPTVLQGSGFSAEFTLGFGVNGTLVGSEVSAKCQQTTLVGGYNTNINELNFLEITNTESNSSINVWLVGTNSVGVGTFTRNYSINSGGRFDVDIHSIVGSAVYGTLFLSHDGPPGSIRAHLAEYKITSASPFTFELSTRDQLTVIKH